MSNSQSSSSETPLVVVSIDINALHMDTQQSTLEPAILEPGPLSKSVRTSLKRSFEIQNECREGLWVNFRCGDTSSARQP